MSTTKDQQEAQYAQILNNDPEMRRIMAQLAALPDHGASALFGDPKAEALIKQYNARVAQLGIDAQEWLPTRHFNGATPTITVDHQNIIERHPTEAGALAVGGLFAAPFIAPSLVGLGGASGGGTAAAGGTTAAAGGTAAGTTAAASTADKIFSNPVVKYGLPVGAAVVGKVLDYKAQSKAADQAQAAADKALALQEAAAAEAKRLAERQYADKAPYRSVGGSAISTLGALMGLPGSPSPATAAPAPAAVNQGGQSGQVAGPPAVTTNPAPSGESFTPDQAMIDRGQMAPPPPTLGSVTSQTVNVRAPNQQVYSIPHERLQEAIAQGGQVVQ